MTIRGRGIIDGSGFATHSDSPVHFADITGTTLGDRTKFLGTNRLSLEGFIIFDSPGWTLKVFHSKYVVIDNVKVIGNHRQNADGMDIVSSKHVRIRNVFIRAWDDAVCLKTMGDCDNTCRNYDTGRYTNEDNNLEDIRTTDSFITTDLANGALEVGGETTSTQIKDVDFENIDIPHAYARAALSVRLYERAHVKNITYKNIRIEDPKGTDTEHKWFVIDVKDEYYTLADNCQGGEDTKMAVGVGAQTGTINGMMFENVKVTRSVPLLSLLVQRGGYNEATVEATYIHPLVAGRITSVVFKNLSINGQKVMTASGAGFSYVPAGIMTFE